MKINFSKVIGKIKAMHGVGQPPFLGMDYSTFQYLKDARIPCSRLHDIGGWMGNGLYVDVPNLFPDFDADENDPTCYTFDYTDKLLNGLVEYDCAPYFRLGVTIENAIRSGLAPRRIVPPADAEKWGRICEHIVRHYNEGWANGYHLNIKYWEIWNEPENGYPGAPLEEANQCWSGTNEEFYALYTAAAKRLKQCFGDSIMVGGYASCTQYGFLPLKELPAKKSKEIRDHRLEFFKGFLAHICKHHAPLDFFSWHSYWDLPHTIQIAREFRRWLDAAGFEAIETHLNEWNNASAPEYRGSAYAAANAVAMMISMQNEPVDLLCYYDARLGVSRYGGMFHPMTKEPFCIYYGFKAFGELYHLGSQVECVAEEEGIYAIAAAKGEERGVLIANIGADRTLSTGLEEFEVYLIDETHFLEKMDWNSAEFTLKENQTVYLKK